MRYVFIKLKVQDGEREYYQPSVHALAKGESTKAHANRWARDFYPYDKVPKKEDGAYYHCGGEVSVSVSICVEIPKDEYAILSCYL